MIIGHYDHEIWAKGGLASYIRRISVAQMAQGHKVFFFSKYDCEGLEDWAQPIVVKDERLLYAKAQELGVEILHLHRSVASLPSRDFPMIRTIHGHQPYCPSGSRFLARWGKPCDRDYHPLGCAWGHVVDRCGSIRPQQMQRGFQETHQEMETLARVPTIAVSEFIRQQMIRSGYPEELVKVLYLFSGEMANAASLPRDGVPHFIFLGRISKQKGVDWLIRSLKRVSEPVHLDIAGSGGQESEMKQLVEKLGLSNQVTFHGWVTPDRVNDLIAGSRAVVFPSVWHEPGGTVAFEAMANRRAVIMSQVGGMPEVVLSGENGLVVKPNDVDGLAQAISCLARDADLASHLGRQGRLMLEKLYPIEKHMQDLMHMYRQTVQLSASRDREIVKIE